VDKIVRNGSERERYASSKRRDATLLGMRERAIIWKSGGYGRALPERGGTSATVT